MGQSSPIELTMTAAGLAAKDSVDNIIFTRFVAGAGGNSLATSVAEVKQNIPIVDYQKYTAGNTYNIDGVDTVATESSLKLTGYANSLDAENNYILNEIGLMAKLNDDGEEFCFAYDWSDTDTRRVRVTRSQGIQIVYNIIFSRQPNLTVNTSATGVTYTDFYNHTQKAVGASAVHGLTWNNNQLSINGQIFDGLSNERLKKIVGIDLYYTSLPTPVMSLLNKVALVTTTNNIYRCQKTIEISTGQFIINDDGWKRANGSEAEAILVIDDGLTPSVNEICLTDAQNHFMEWIQLNNFESRLKYLEANSQFLQYDPLDNREYNNEWVDRMTGSGTAASPFCIYTPKDFSMIGKTEQYGLDKVYKLMNNLDFESVIGMTASINDDSYQITTVDQNAPMYNNGEGYRPIGYNGYYPATAAEGENKTWNEIKALEDFNYNSDFSAVRGNIQSTEYSLKYAFNGELHGNSKVIKGIICSPVNTYSVGLFMFLTKSAKIHDLTIKDSIFILSDVWFQPDISTDRYWYLGSIAGTLLKGNLNQKYTVNIYNVYNYASLINNASTNSFSDSSRAYTAGILGFNGNQETVKFIIENCANHGQLIYVTESIKHNICGIVCSNQHGNDSQEVMNCINTISFSGHEVSGIGDVYTSKGNINAGIITSYYNNINPAFSNLKVIADPGAVDSASIGYYNDNNYDNQSTNNISGRNTFEAKSPSELKSEDLITEINSYLATPAWAYNDLNVNDGWPLLIDEYNTLTGINGNLSLAVIDPVNKKIYKSGLPMKKFQTIPTYKEMVANTNQTVESKITQFNDSTLAGLKVSTSTISTSDWNLDADTNKYLATKSITGVSASTPIQLLTQFSVYEISINNVSSNAVVFQCDSEPASDIKVSVMFTD